jgi:PAS domain S-box-containing protein
MSPSIRILFADVPDSGCELVHSVLASQPDAFALTCVTSRAAFEQELATHNYDLIISDLDGADFAGLDILDAIRARSADMPIIIVTAAGSEEIAVEAMKRGASDYLRRTDSALQRLPQAIRAALAQQQQHAEQQQMLQELRLRDRAIAATSDGIVITDAHQPDNPLIYCNPAFERITGYRRDEIIGRNSRFLQGPATDPASIAQLRQAVQTGQSCRVTIVNYRRDGSAFHSDLSVAPIHDEQGHLTHFIGIKTDITARKQAEDRVRQYLARTELLAQTAARLNASLDVDTISSAVCQASAQALDVSVAGICLYDEQRGHFALRGAVGLPTRAIEALQDIAPATIDMLLHQDEPLHVLPDLLASNEMCPGFAALMAADVRTVMCASLARDGARLGVLFCATIGSTHTFTTDEITTLQGIANQAAQAITNAHLLAEVQHERMLLEQRVAEKTAALQHLNVELERAAYLKDAFLASMSHELRTPLNAILGYTEALIEQTRGPLNERQIQALQRVGESGQHLLSLISDILDISHLQRGELHLTITPVALAPLCESSLQCVAQTAAKKHISIASLIDPALHTIRADGVRLRQMLDSLLSNAVKFTPAGGAIGLEIAADQHNRTVRFTVWDTGIGIAAEDLPHLFQPFLQLDSRLNRDFAGTGVGLALVERIARLHGGSVSVQSEVGEGSYFHIVLPLDANQVAAPEPAAPAPCLPPAPEQEASPPLILIAEDDAATTMIVQDYLDNKGYRVRVADNGHDALSQAHMLQPDLILMDVQMPGLDGLEVTRRIRTNPALAHTPIIALTALAMPGDRERCLEAGASDYLSKPMRLAHLTQTIETYLASPLSCQAVT